MSNSRDIADSAATINYIDTVTSNVQTQLDNKDSLPSQTGNSGEFLTTNGTVASWAAVDALPTQSGQSGKFLTTNGTAAAWDAVDVSSEITGTLPVANGGIGATTLTANNVLLGNGTSAPQAVAPSTSGNVLTSDGTTWASTAPAGGGGWELLKTVTGSAALTFDITDCMSDSYYDYVIEGNLDVANGVYPNPLGFEFQKSGGTYQTSGYATYYWGSERTGTSIDTGTGVGGSYNLTGTYINPDPVYLRIHIARPQTSSGGNSRIYVQAEVNGRYSSLATALLSNGGVNIDGDYTGIRIKDFRAGPATFTGTIRAWGRKTS